MRKIVLLLLLLALVNSPLLAQVDTAWSKLMISPLDDHCSAAIRLRNGDFLLSGKLNEEEEYQYDFFRMQLNSAGVEVSRQTTDMIDEMSGYLNQASQEIGDGYVDYVTTSNFEAIQPTSDGGYLIPGFVNFLVYPEEGNEHMAYGPVLWKLDIDGSTIWMHGYGDGSLNLVGATSIGRNFLLVGNKSGEDAVVSILKIDPWGRVVGEESIEADNLICRDFVTHDELSALACTRRIQIDRRTIYQPTLLIIDAYGSLIERFDYDVEGSVEDYKIARLANGTYILACTVIERSEQNISRRVHLIEIDRAGMEISRRWIDAQTHTTISTIVPTWRRGYACSLQTGEPNQAGEVLNWDLYYYEADGWGDSLRAFQIRGEEEEKINAVVYNPDGSLLLAGSTESFNARQSDVWLLMVNPPENEAKEKRETIPFDLPLAQFYPNPFNSRITIDLGKNLATPVDIIVLTRTGQQVGWINQMQSNAKVFWDAGDLPAGQYFFEIRSPGSSMVKPVTLLR